MTYRWIEQYPQFKNFNSHAHVERDSNHLCSMILVNDFNSHAHVERDNMMGILSLQIKYFNSHAHVERDYKKLINYFTLRYFNSHAHVERDNIDILHSSNKLISTHTLTWSVTFLGKHKFKHQVFQLTRSRGA